MITGNSKDYRVLLQVLNDNVHLKTMLSLLLYKKVFTKEEFDEAVELCWEQNKEQKETLEDYLKISELNESSDDWTEEDIEFVRSYVTKYPDCRESKSVEEAVKIMEKAHQFKINPSLDAIGESIIDLFK